MLCVNHKAEVEELSLVIRKGFVRTDRAKNCFGCRLIRLCGVDIHTLLEVMSPLDLISICHNDRKLTDKLNGLTDNIFKRCVVGRLIIGIKSENRPRDLVHNVRGGSFHHCVLDEVLGKITADCKDILETCQLFRSRKRAENEQPGDLLIAESVLLLTVLYNLLHIESTEIEMTLFGYSFAVLYVVTVNGADLCDTCHNTCSVGVTQSSFYIETIKIIGIYFIAFVELFNQRLSSLIC